MTAGSRGIGRAITERLAADGANVVFTYATNRSAADSVAAVVTAAGGHAPASRPTYATVLPFATSTARPSPSSGRSTSWSTTRASVVVRRSTRTPTTTIDVNLRAPFVLMREAASRLRDAGRIINISTLNTVLPAAGIGPYAASKAALELLGRVLAYELGGRDITVNAVLPGASDTDMFNTFNPDPQAHDQVAAATVLGRIGQPADIADVVAFLAGPDARWLTGQSIRATGGLA
jgi:3-oxoacyl-[acyl-carrier protein] reductase